GGQRAKEHGSTASIGPQIPFRERLCFQDMQPSVKDHGCGDGMRHGGPLLRRGLNGLRPVVFLHPPWSVIREFAMMRGPRPPHATRWPARPPGGAQAALPMV